MKNPNQIRILVRKENQRHECRLKTLSDMLEDYTKACPHPKNCVDELDYDGGDGYNYKCYRCGKLFKRNPHGT